MMTETRGETTGRVAMRTRGNARNPYLIERLNSWRNWLEVRYSTE
jgi:hypothetical protein